MITYGHFETISSSLKVYWPGTFATGWWVNSIPGVKIRMILPVCVALFAFPLLLRNTLSQRNVDASSHFGVDVVLIGANAYVVLHALVLIMFASGGVASWYFALSLTIGIVTGVHVGHQIIEWLSLGKQLSNIIGVVLLMVVLLATLLYLKPRFVAKKRIHQLRVAEWLRDNISADEVIFQIDGTGFTGYFSERRVIDGDGLVNSWEYQRYLRSGRIDEYLRAKGVSYIVSHKPPRKGWVTLYIPMWDGNWTLLGSAPVSAALFKSGPYSVYRIVDFDIGREAPDWQQ